MFGFVVDVDVDEVVTVAGQLFFFPARASLSSKLAPKRFINLEMKFQTQAFSNY